MMGKFTYDDIVRVRKDAPERLRFRARAWVIAVFNAHEDRPGAYFDMFPEGTVYMIEYEDGDAVAIHESDLEADND
jgi:hypothetical protein